MTAKTITDPSISRKSGRKKASRARGFALIVTISLMVLLTIIAVGLLSLSAINLRTASQSKAKGEARANARLALLVALGELQRQIGPDQRITASAEMLGESVANPSWVGVWDANTRGRPDYAPGRPQSFRRWLVSGPSAESDDAPERSLADGVTLVSARGGKPAVRAGRVPIESNRSQRPPGAFAWWVADESMKARVDLPSDPDVEDDAMLIAQRYAARRNAPEVIPGMDGFDPLNAERLITVGTNPRER